MMSILQDSLFIGRQQQLGMLDEVFDKNNLTIPQFILVGGVAGVGKTGLVEHFLSNRLSNADKLLYGKYVEEQSTIPYLGIVRALQSYIESLANLPTEQKQAFVDHVTGMLSNNLGVLQQQFSSLVEITGISESVHDLQANESRNRYLLVMNKFMQVICENYRKTVLFLDDLHWADSETMLLLESLLENEALHSLIIIGTYRIEDVGVSHSLSKTLRALKKAGGNIHRIDLQEMDLRETRQIVHAYTGLQNSECNGFTEYLQEKTSGNPLYIRELLDSIMDENRNMPRGETCHIDLSSVREADASNNVVDLLILRLNKMSPEAQIVLKVAACVGSIFDSRLLAQVCRKSIEYIEKALLHSIDYGFIRYADTGNGFQVYYFTHDRVRESAYEQLDDKTQIHLKIGRFLSEKFDSVSIGDVVFHYNLGLEHLIDPEEKYKLCELNLQAATVARNSGAYSSAVSNLHAARKLLPVDGWTRYHEMTYQVYRNLTECHYLNGDFDEAEQLCHICLERVTTKRELAEIYKLKVVQLTNLGKWADAVAFGAEGLRVFDIDFEDSSQVEAIRQSISDVSQSDLQQLNDCLDLDVIALEQLMSTLVSPVYVLRPDLLEPLISKMVLLSIEYGRSVESVYAFLMFGFFLSARGEYRKGNEFAEYSLSILQKDQYFAIRSKVKLTFVTNISPWVNKLSDGFDMLEQSAGEGVEAGDIITAGYCLVSKGMQLFSAGQNLVEIKTYIDAKLPFLQKTSNPVISLVTIIRQMILNLIGRTDSINSISTADYSAADALNAMQEAGFQHGIHWYGVNRMLLAIINDDMQGVDEYIGAAKSAATGAVGQFSLAELNFYDSLLMTRRYQTASPAQQTEYASALSANQAQMEIWAAHCPENFRHKYLLVEAERAAVTGAEQQALNLYREARVTAERHGFVQDAAITCERCAGFCKVSQGMQGEVTDWLQAAGRYYQTWGASRKAPLLNGQ
ncbi:MAG: AAA family ATPase [Gammaproteobacteria bacterium]|nr:AAA family ATPase [Gammaproteobacteria bacterium]MDH5653147.1 AAA family ATPase [Gammaproteobacteria bacterium]